MQRFLSRRLAAATLIAIATSVVVYFLIDERPSRAQERSSERSARFEQFVPADAITNDIRDSSKELVHVELHSIAERENVAKIGRIVQDFGSSVVVSKRKSLDLSRTGFDAYAINGALSLPGAKFDPITEPRAETVRATDPSESRRGYYLVQLGGIATDEWLDSIRDAGLEIVQYVPHNAFFVFGEHTAAVRVAGHSRVRWVGEYRAEHKLAKEVKEFAQRGETEKFDVAVFANADLAQIGREIGGRSLAVSRLPNNFFNVIRVEISPLELERIAAIDGVFRVDPYVTPTREDERAAQIVAGNYSSPTVINAPGYNPFIQFGVDGFGVTISVVDDGISIPGNGGFYLTAANTVDGPLRGATAGASGGHGHINGSIIAGNAPFGLLDPTGYNYGLGIAPKANIINIPFLKSGNTTTDAQAVDDTLNTAGPNGVKGTISNNSWGSNTNGNVYDSFAAQYDGLVRDGSFAASIDPFNIIFSAGNSGTSGLTRPKVAKNIIAVANSENLRTEFTGTGADNMDDLRSTSSRGPAADGRIKPDITAPGTVITGSRAGSCSSVTLCFDANHAYSTGTSHAAPQVAGAAALFTQYWRNSHIGLYPSPSLVKAAIINTAQDMNGNLTTDPRPNGAEGWGRINLKLMLNTGATIKYVNEEEHLSSPGTAVNFVGNVAEASKPVRVTLTWTDPPGVADPALVNNLNLTVTIGSNTYRGNVFAGGNSTTGGASDNVNNVENIFLPAGIPAGTPFSISVDAVTLNGDGILGNADVTDQHFSLVAYNFQSPETGTHPPVDFDGDHRTEISIFRPSNQQWWALRSTNGGIFSTAFGAETQPGQPVPTDYTGDGKADVAVWRNTDGMWLIQRSEDYSYYAQPFGANGDVPVPADYDGDSKADLAVFRASAGLWIIQKSLSGATEFIQFGSPGDRVVHGDYDGDSRTDVAVFRPLTGQWWVNRSSAGVIVFTFGNSDDKLVPGDYTGDEKNDAAIWRPSTGEWFILRSEDFSYYSLPFGTATDLPVPGDYDGDGESDLAVFRPSTATWFVDRSTAGILIQNFGLPTDTPLPNAFVP